MATTDRQVKAQIAGRIYTHTRSTAREAAKTADLIFREVIATEFTQASGARAQAVTRAGADRKRSAAARSARRRS
jgi:hypothetical protein